MKHDTLCIFLKITDVSKSSNFRESATARDVIFDLIRKHKAIDKSFRKPLLAPDILILGESIIGVETPLSRNRYRPWWSGRQKQQ